MSAHGSCRERLNENTTEVEVFQNMTDFQLPTEYSTFDLSIRMQFPKFSRGFSCTDFKTFIHENVGEEYVVALGRLAFPNEWQLQVTDREVREKLIRMQKTKINMRTCWISPLSQSEVRGHVHWLPTETHFQAISKTLELYGDVLLLERQNQIKFDMKTKSDMIYFALFLKNGFTMDDVPYFIFVEGHQGFVSIRGRSPVCFHCRVVGHRKNECELFRSKLKSYCNKRPGRGRRLRPRGLRYKSVEQIEAQKNAEESCAVGAAAGTTEQVQVNPPGATGEVTEALDSMNAEESKVPEFEQSMEVDEDDVPKHKQSVEEGLDAMQSVPEGEDKLGENFKKLHVLLSGRGDNEQLSSVAPNPVVQLQELQKDVVDTLTNTAEALNEKIEVATRVLCDELKAKKKKKKKQKKK